MGLNTIQEDDGEGREAPTSGMNWLNELFTDDDEAKQKLNRNWRELQQLTPFGRNQIKESILIMIKIFIIRWKFNENNYFLYILWCNSSQRLFNL